MHENARFAGLFALGLAALGCSTGNAAGDRAAVPPSPKPIAVWIPAANVPAIASTPAAVPRPAAPPPVVALPKVDHVRSSALPSGFFNPMPGGVFAGYEADTGLDIAGSPRAVYALAAGTLDYSEEGHTLWTGPKDTPNCVRFELDTPIPWKGRRITHVYYAHLSKLAYQQAEDDKQRRHVEGGEYLGESGVANHSPHLHIGLLLDGETRQYWGSFLSAAEIRKVLGDYRNGVRLPAR